MARPGRLYGTLYIDNATTPQQRLALTRMFEFINTAANDSPVPLRRMQGCADHIPGICRPQVLFRRYSVYSRGECTIRTRRLGKPAFHHGCYGFVGKCGHNADNERFKYNNPEAAERWDYSGHYANLKFFDVSKKMYADQQMLGQHGDNSGKWTPKQLEIIG